MLTVKQLAERLNVNYRSLQNNWRRLGIPAVQVGRQIRFREYDVETWLAEHEVS